MTPTPKNLSYELDKCNKTATPYPNNGIILQSLNYIQMDVFSSLFPNDSYKETKSTDEKHERPATNLKREPAVVSEALYNIENNFRSLF